MTFKTYKNWSEVCAGAEEWGDAGLTGFIRAERRVAERSPRSAAFYRNTAFFPGTLQHPLYIQEICRVAYLTPIWTQKNSILRQTRQLLLGKTAQHFLVDQLALTYFQGSQEIVAKQLAEAIRKVRTDMQGENLLDFRVVEGCAASNIQANVHHETFALFETEDGLEGFEEHSITHEITRFENEKLELLRQSWGEIGAVSLGRVESLELMIETLHEL